MSNIAYLTCELKSRDLDSRLLLAAHLVRRGMDVFVGQQWSLFGNAAIAPVGVYVFKSANQIQAREMARAKSGGHAVVTSDEEMMASVNPEHMLRNTHPDAIANSDLFLFQTEMHERVIKEAYPAVRGERTGNARADLLARFGAIYDEEAEALRARGKYILINTNFSLTNSVWGDRARVRTVAQQAGTLRNAADEAVLAERMATEEVCRQHLWTVAERLVREFGGYRVVVRPHPAEDPELWKAVAGVEVVVGSNPVPWLRGADLLVHTNCTTGLEGTLLGRTCLNVNPAPGATQFVANVNYTVNNADTALDVIRAFLVEGGGPLAAFTPPLADYPVGAIERIAEAIAQTAAGLPPAPTAATWNRYVRKEVHAQKFTVSRAEVESRMAMIGKLLGLRKVTIEEADDSLFLMRGQPPAS